MKLSAMVDRGIGAVRISACLKQPIYYKDFSKIIGAYPGSPIMNNVFKKMMESDKEKNRPLFCSMVVSSVSDEMMPSQGFFKAAKELGYDFSSETDFVREMQEKCFAYMVNAR